MLKFKIFAEFRPDFFIARIIIYTGKIEIFICI